MKKKILILALLCAVVQGAWAQTSGFQKLDKWTEKWKPGQQTYFGYPVNQQSKLHEFYEWYLAAGMEVVNLNNAGDPMTDEPWSMSSQAFEREVIEYFAPLYGFEQNDVWGIVTHSGTDGNNHGIYFGANYLKNKTQLEPVVYVSDETHYSNMRLAHLQNLEMKLIKSDAMGRMIPEELERELDTVFFRRPSADIISLYNLAQGYDENFGGNLTHVVVMQHVTKEKIDVFVNALKAEATALKSVRANAADNTNEVKKVLRDTQVLIQSGDTFYNTAGVRR